MGMSELIMEIGIFLLLFINPGDRIWFLSRGGGTGSIKGLLAENHAGPMLRSNFMVLAN